MYPTVVNTTYTSGAMESTMHGKVGVLRVVAVSLEAAVEKKSRLRCWYRPHNPGLPPPPSGGERGETFYTGESVLFNTPSVCRHQPDKRCRPVCVNRFSPRKGEGDSSAQSAPPLHGAGARHTHKPQP